MKNKNENPTFLSETEFLGVIDPCIRTIVDSLFLEYYHEATSILTNNNDHNQQMQMYGARKTLERLLMQLGQPELIQKLKQNSNQDLVNHLSKTNEPTPSSPTK